MNSMTSMVWWILTIPSQGAEKIGIASDRFSWDLSDEIIIIYKIAVLCKLLEKKNAEKS